MKSDMKLGSVESENKEFRKYPRLKVDLGTFAKLYLNNEHDKPLNGTVIDSSLGGCGIVIVVEQKEEDLLEQGKICQIKFFEECDDLVEIKIAWMKKIDNNIYKIGFQYLDDDSDG